MRGYPGRHLDIPGGLIHHPLRDQRPSQAQVMGRLGGVLFQLDRPLKAFDGRPRPFVIEQQPPQVGPTGGVIGRQIQRLLPQEDRLPRLAQLRQDPRQLGLALARWLLRRGRLGKREGRESLALPSQPFRQGLIPFRHRPVQLDRPPQETSCLDRFSGRPSRHRAMIEQDGILGELLHQSLQQGEGGARPAELQVGQGQFDSGLRIVGRYLDRRGQGVQAGIVHSCLPVRHTERPPRLEIGDEGAARPVRFEADNRFVHSAQEQIAARQITLRLGGTLVVEGQPVDRLPQVRIIGSWQSGPPPVLRVFHQLYHHGRQFQLQGSVVRRPVTCAMLT